MASNVPSESRAPDGIHPAMHAARCPVLMDNPGTDGPKVGTRPPDSRGTAIWG